MVADNGTASDVCVRSVADVCVLTNIVPHKQP